MMIAARNAFLMGGAKLPYDAEVEYIESTGTQYIDTGVTPPYAATVVFDAKVGVTTADGTRRFLFSDGNSNKNHYAEIGSGMRFGAGNNYCPVTLQASTLYDTAIIFSSSQFDASVLVGGVVYTKSSTTGATASWGRLILFRLNASYTGRNQMLGRIRITVNSATLRDFIPVRVGSVGYLYDRANPTGGPLGNGLYGNAADGQGGKAGFPANCVGPDK